MKPTREEVIRVAREAGAFLELSTTPEKDMAFLMRFAERFYEAGAAAAMEPLVEALKNLLWLLDNPDMAVKQLDAAIDDSRVALAKATGEKT